MKPMKRIIPGLKLTQLGRAGLGLSLWLYCGWGQTTAVWGQTGNASDITGVDAIEITPKLNLEPRDSETEDSETEDSETGDSGTESSIDRNAVDKLLTSPNLPPSNTFTLQSQVLTISYNQILQDLGIQLEGQTISPETIDRLLTLSFNLTGNNAHYVQISLTQDDQMVMTRLGPNSTQQSLASKAVHKGDLRAGYHFPHTGVLSQERDEKPGLLTQSPEDPERETELVSRYVAPNLSGDRIQRLIQEYRSQLERDGSLATAIGQRLYDLLIRPMEADLQAAGADTIVFALDSQLLGLPLAALQDGETPLVEKYAVTVIPSFGLADIGYTDIRQRSVLAMGSSTFQDQAALPGVPVELSNISQLFTQRSLLDDQFTVTNFVETFQDMVTQGERPGIIHLATHGEFASGDYRNSYIQFQDRRVSLVEFRNLAVQLGWDLAETAPEMLVLSACRTAIGDPTAELGFGGLAIATGAKTALASLWYVSDLGTLALMSEFYEVLQEIPFKSQALQQAQLNLLKGSTQLRSGQLILTSGKVVDLPPDLAKLPDQDFSNPYYWSAFTLIGNWN